MSQPFKKTARFYPHQGEKIPWAEVREGLILTDEGEFALPTVTVWPIWATKWCIAWLQDDDLWCRAAAGGDIVRVVSAQTAFGVENQLYAVGTSIMSIRIGYLSNRLYGIVRQHWPLPSGVWRVQGDEVQVHTSVGIKCWRAQPPGGLWQP